MSTTQRPSSVFAIAATAAMVARASMRANGDVATLAGAEWRLVDVNGKAAVPAEQARRPWIRFDADLSRITGSAGATA